MDNFKKNRSFQDRRRFTYTAYSPERRSGTDRREIKNEFKSKAA